MIAAAPPNLPCLSLLSPVCVKSWLCMRMFLSVLRLAARDAAMSIATETPTGGKSSARPHPRRGSVAPSALDLRPFPPEVIFSLPLFTLPVRESISFFRLFYFIGVFVSEYTVFFFVLVFVAFFVVDVLDKFLQMLWVRIVINFHI